MQYNVPQFVDVEDKIIGPLTLKQFVILLLGAIIGFMLWSIFGPSFAFFFLVVPIALIFLYLALGRFNGQPVLMAIPAFLQFFLRPRYRVFRRIVDKSLLLKKKKEPKETQPEPEEEAEPKGGSRLKKLAYILDQRAAEEERLVHPEGGESRNINI